MPRISAQRQDERLEAVWALVKTHGIDGIKTREVWETLEFPERTVRDYLYTLEEQFRVRREGQFWFPTEAHLQKPLRLEPSPEQAVILYIALRMFVKQSDRRNPLAINLLLKLANLANTELNLGAELEQAASELAHKEEDADYEDVYRTVVRAYIQSKRLQIVYHPYHSEPFTTTIEPYLIKPSAFGYGTYVIGHSSTPDALRTYKLERIREAKLLHETFTKPDDFPGLEILRNSWSIYYGEEPVQVVLRFAPEVARRVRESNWRGVDSKPVADPEKPGYLLMVMDIADTTDLKPWIRTWGANVEVLEPQSLRKEMKGEARAIAQLYGWDTSGRNSNPHSRFGDIFGG